MTSSPHTLAQTSSVVDDQLDRFGPKLDEERERERNIQTKHKASSL